MNNTTGDDYTTFGEYKAGILIWKVVPPILILFGTIGNILSIVVLTRKSIKASTTALYLTFLAFSDLLVLHTGLLRQWLNYLTEYDVRHTSEAACKIHIWLVYSSLDFSAWILIAVTLERVISTWCPHSAKTKCNRKYATILIISIMFLSLALNSHLLFGMVNKVTIDDKGQIKTIDRCATIDPMYANFFNVTWPWIDLCAFCLIPFTVIVVGNSCILFKVIKSRQKAKSRIRPSLRSTHKSSSHIGPTNSSMTAMLFTLNMVFLFTTSPVSIYNIGYPHWLSGASEPTIASLEFWWAVVNMLMYTNNSINFLLYCLSGSRFRQEVKRLFCSMKCRGINLTLGNFTKTKFPTQERTPTSFINSERNAPTSRKTSNTSQVPHGDRSSSYLCVLGNNLCLHPNAALNNLNNAKSGTQTNFTDSKESIQPCEDVMKASELDKPSTNGSQMTPGPKCTSTATTKCISAQSESNDSMTIKAVPQFKKDDSNNYAHNVPIKTTEATKVSEIERCFDYTDKCENQEQKVDADLSEFSVFSPSECKHTDFSPKPSSNHEIRNKENLKNLSQDKSKVYLSTISSTVDDGLNLESVSSV